MATSTSRSFAVVVQLLLVFSVFFSILQTGTSLRCYKCDDKQIGLDWCSQPEEEECENDDSSICLKYVYRAGKKNWPNHIIFKCVPRSDYSRSQINACDRSTRRRPDGTILLYETCTCDKDLCNDKDLNSSSMSDKEREAENGNDNGDNDSPEKDSNTEKDHSTSGALRIRSVRAMIFLATAIRFLISRIF